MNHSLLTFYRSLLHGLFLNKKRHRLILFKGVFVTIIFIFPTLCNGSDQKVDSLKQLIEIYDPTDCRECHEEIYDQWQNSHHARSISGIFMERYLKIGPLSVKDPADATKKNFPCFKCHFPQLEKATDAVAAEIAGVILNNDKATMKKLNISCMVCHQRSAKPVRNRQCRPPTSCPSAGISRSSSMRTSRLARSSRLPAAWIAHS